jgi:hypothetical protein
LIQARGITVHSRKTLKIEEGILGLKGRVKYDRYKDMFLEEGKIGEVTVVETIIREETIGMIEIGMMKIRNDTQDGNRDRKGNARKEGPRVTEEN